MNQKLLNFKEKILEEPLSKTDKYWLDQVDFKTNNGNELSLYVDSDFDVAITTSEFVLVTVESEPTVKGKSLP